MQSLIQKFTTKNRLHGLLLLALSAMALMWLSVAPLNVNAEPQNTDPITAHCLQKAKSKYSKACWDKQNIQYVRNGASNTDQCKKTPIGNNKKAECIEKQAIAYIDKTIAKNPKSEADFKGKLKDVLKAAGVDREHASPDSQQSDHGEVDCGPNPCSTTLDPSYCAAYSKENPSKPLPEGCGSDASASCTKNACDLVEKYANPAIDMLSLAFGIVAVISLILGGINYTTSEGDPQKSSKAKQRIFNTLVAIFAYLFLYSFLQFLIPGGIF